jgi:hypothetical protein
LHLLLVLEHDIRIYSLVHLAFEVQAAITQTLEMADLVGIAGLTIAAFDKIWLIGSKTAEIISDYREFDKVKDTCQWSFASSSFRLKCNAQ